MSTTERTSSTLIENLKSEVKTRERYSKSKKTKLLELEVLRGEMAQLTAEIDKMTCGIDMTTRTINSLQEQIAISLETIKE